MIETTIMNRIATDIESLMIKDDDVANVIVNHSLVNALMILSNAKYSLIPVLTSKSELVGLINMQCIIEACTTESTIDFALLEDKTVEDINLLEPMTLSLDDSIELLIYKLIDNNFVCIVDSDNVFQGIVTRRTILKRINQLLHTL